METEVSKKLDDIHDFLVNSDLTSIPASVFEDLKYLEDHIADLERCVVMGGDGKPLRIGNKAYYWSECHEKACEVPINSMEKVGRKDCINRYPHQLNASDCYSSPDSVPEGDKE